MEFLTRWYGRRAKYKNKESVLRRESAYPKICVILIVLWLTNLSLCNPFACDEDDPSRQCVHGSCINDRCECYRGWQGTFCQQCGGRVKLTEKSGFISDGLKNYSIDMQCAWLIDSGEENATIRLNLLHFETECSWDHLYIFDGDSLFSRLVAAFSGVLMREEWDPSKIPEIITHSGYAYLYFYSDAALNMSGFNISYSVNGCPKQNCSNHGVCIDSVCTCDGGWTGDGCDIPFCPNNCTNGECQHEEHKCQCKEGFKGKDCSLKVDELLWEVESVAENAFGRALHQMVVYKDALWIVGGENFVQNEYLNVLKYNFTSKEWEVLEPSTITDNRFGHSLVVYKDKFYVYGGMLQNGSIMSDLWQFDPETREWDQVQESSTSSRNRDCQPELCSPVASAGHTSNTVKDSMIVIFGHHLVYGYLNTVQEFNFVTGKWELIKTRGAIVKGGYGHSSVYDRNSQLIFVYGGYHSTGADGVLVDYLYSYHPWDKSWKLLTPSFSPSFLHSAIVINKRMLVFGGNVHNGTAAGSSYSGADKCFSSDFLEYDIELDEWQKLNYSGPFKHELARLGQSAVTYKDSVYVFGGFNGLMLKDLLKFTPGSCKSFKSRETCKNTAQVIKCDWDHENSKCISKRLSFSKHNFKKLQKTVNVTSLCTKIKTCPTCIDNSYGCVWCGTNCAHGDCINKSTATDNSKDCEDQDSSNCENLHNCHVCHTEYHCGWQNDKRCYTFVKDNGNKTEKAILSEEFRVRCETPCSHYRTCENCTESRCMWCSSKNICIDSNTYVASFPIAQCLEWTTQSMKCPGLMCKDIQSCERCLQNPRCGWCDDGSGTGLGSCMDGGGKGPMVRNGSFSVVDSTMCPVPNWYFTHCPMCQCNGHSTCINDTSICIEPCNHLTEGPNCQQCMAGYYGNPINGGNCTPCLCNQHGDMCNTSTGKCYCIAKGIIGDQCDKCDESNHYIGNPKEIGGTCFYNLSIDFQYTFNMSKPEDSYYTQINFMNSPPKPDIDVDFTISCTVNALVNITLGSALTGERILHENRKCGSFKHRFSHNELSIGLENTTFYVYVFDFKTPFVLQISFSQHRTLDLLQFFITFSSCFLSLLIIAAILWKIKQKYDLYRRRQRLFVEMEQMASRPFSGVAVDFEQEKKDSLKANVEGHTKSTPNHPTPVALEPCSGGKAAVLTLIIRLSNGGEEYTPDSQSALAMGSTLVSLGPTCKHTADIIKDETKFEVLKISNNSNACI